MFGQATRFDIVIILLLTKRHLLVNQIFKDSIVLYFVAIQTHIYNWEIQVCS